MCYFHVVSCCKRNLRSHPAATQKMISDEVYFLHTSVSQVEFEARYAEVAIKWRRDFPEFARYFSAQWILGNFTNWKIYCSEPGIASTNNALECEHTRIFTCTSSVRGGRSTRTFRERPDGYVGGHKEAERWQYVRRPRPTSEGAIPLVVIFYYVRTCTQG